MKKKENKQLKFWQNKTDEFKADFEAWDKKARGRGFSEEQRRNILNVLRSKRLTLVDKYEKKCLLQDLVQILSNVIDKKIAL